MVCQSCHRSLGEGLAVHATGEFKVPTAEMLAAVAAEPPPQHPGERVRATNVCAWCGKLEPEVKKLLGRNGVALCDECVSLCVDILDAELGTNWR
jgi:hypothetical protein